MNKDLNNTVNDKQEEYDILNKQEEYNMLNKQEEYKEKIRIINLICSVIKDIDERYKYKRKEIYKLSLLLK